MSNMITPIEISDFNLNKIEIEGKSSQYLEFKAENGKLEFTSTEIDVNDVKIHIDNNIRFEGLYNSTIPERETFNLKLNSEDGWEIELTKCAIGSMGAIHGGKFEGTALNFQAKQGEIENEEKVKVNQLIENLKFDDYPIQLISNDLNGLLLFNEEKKDFPNSTGYFAFIDKYELIKNRWYEIFNNFHYLFGFFSSNFISLRVTYIEGINGKEIRITTPNDSANSRFSIFYKRPWQTFKFLNSSYDNFVKFKNDLNLQVVISYYTWMKNSSFIDSHKYLMGVILMETLKFAYASKIKNYPKPRSHFQKPNSSGNYRDIYFKELIKEIYAEFNLDINKIHARYLKIEFQKSFNCKIPRYYPIDFYEISKNHNFVDDLSNFRNKSSA